MGSFCNLVGNARAVHAHRGTSVKDLPCFIHPALAPHRRACGTVGLVHLYHSVSCAHFALQPRAEPERREGARGIY